MEKKTILAHLKKFIGEKKAGEVNKQTANLISVLESITEEKISVGEAPKYFFASITCNSTGVGESSFEGTKTQKTVSMDYVTNEYLFVDGHMGAGGKGLSLFYLKPGQTINYFHKNDIVKKSKEYGFRLHSQAFRDLNFRLTDHRLNRHTVNITKGPFSYPVYPICAVISEKCTDYTLGYIYEQNDKEYIIIEPEDPKKAAKRGKNKFFSPWMLLALICPPLIIVVAIVILVKIYKERMVG